MAMVSRPENWQQIVDELLEILGASDSLLQEESWEHLSERHLNIYIYVIYIYICMYVCMYVCMYIYIYIHTDIKAYDLRMSKKYSTTHTHTPLHYIGYSELATLHRGTMTTGPRCLRTVQVPKTSA